ncbi:MAG: autotransporter domain-containing protein, partial [Hyphomicrobiales bacterium]|nr:autotransporter domain-containing protein [Hyphomicrobiales bacterium]
LRERHHAGPVLHRERRARRDDRGRARPHARLEPRSACGERARPHARWAPWSHEFLEASQKITAALVGVAGSGFSATGIAFGRDAALIGAGFSMELSADAKVFVDYDGRLASRLQEHSISGGLKVRF